jgi:hypothetical protein
MTFQQSLLTEDWSRLHHLPCLPSEEHPNYDLSAPRGHLLDNVHLETILQGLLIFGPSTFILIAAPIRIVQLHHAKLVTLSNYRGLVKAVS